MSAKSLTTYQERATKMNKKARKALFRSIANDWAVARSAVREAAQLEVVAINRLRMAGIKLQEAAGREQVSFDFFHSTQGELPKDMSFSAVKFCIHLARKLLNPVKTLDEARSARQMMFEAMGEATAPKRLEAQVSHESNPWSDFVSGASSFTALFDRLDDAPMEKWGREKL